MFQHKKSGNDVYALDLYIYNTVSTSVYAWSWLINKDIWFDNKMYANSSA
jgi:hypothetical protein